jgi:hypothetical protein
LRAFFDSGTRMPEEGIDCASGQIYIPYTGLEVEEE